MDKIRLGLFDVFAYLLPGIPLYVLIALFIQNEAFCLCRVREICESMGAFTGVLVLSACYVLGFSIQYPAYQIFKVIVEAAGPKYTKGHPISLSKRGVEIASIRHASSTNYDTLHTFMAMRSMGYSLFFSLGLFSIGLVVLCALHCSWMSGTAAMVIATALLSFLSLINAVRFIASAKS